MIERKPPRMAAYSEDALTRGADLYQIFRKLVSLDAPLAADVVSVIARETGLGERRIRELARRYRSKPIAESLASRPRGPKPGSRQAPPEVLVAINGLIEEIVMTKVPLSVREAAQQVRYLLIADNGDYGFDPGIVPSFRTIERIIGEISEPQKARFRVRNGEPPTRCTRGNTTAMVCSMWSRWITPPPTSYLSTAHTVWLWADRG